MDNRHQISQALRMKVTIEPIRVEDAEAIVAAEDEETIRWLTGGRATIEGTRDHVRALSERAAAGSTKRGFCIWVDGGCVGTVDFDADPQEGIGPGDVNISYALAPHLRGHGITSRAVDLLCGIIRDRGVGARAVIRRHCVHGTLPALVWSWDSPAEH